MHVLLSSPSCTMSIHGLRLQVRPRICPGDQTANKKTRECCPWLANKTPCRNPGMMERAQVFVPCRQTDP